MTAAAIASRSAMIDFHGRVLRLTCATFADRSICLSCTRRSSFRVIRPNAIRQEGAAPDLLAQRQALGSGPYRPRPQRLRDRGTYLISGLPTGNLSFPSTMPLETRANEVYQATKTVTSPM